MLRLKATESRWVTFVFCLVLGRSHCTILFIPPPQPTRSKVPSARLLIFSMNSEGSDMDHRKLDSCAGPICSLGFRAGFAVSFPLALDRSRLTPAPMQWTGSAQAGPLEIVLPDCWLSESKSFNRLRKSQAGCYHDADHDRDCSQSILSPCHPIPFTRCHH
jgi:hypothetical protein|mmetsp:Transcript_53492/g.88084  ORF Transcript_53492/g.88084 Transcript_53492/m.88084 type:complete len:161 (+) Transcript_53492:2456-2938(+)